MARRRKIEKKETEPDPIYNSKLVSKFINKIMCDGKKTIARKITYGALEKFINNIEKTEVISAFEELIENTRPLVQVRSRRIGGATYQVPTEVPEERSQNVAISWIITAARNLPGVSMLDALAKLFTDCYKKQGIVIKKREDTHKMAEANAAFAQYNCW